MSYGSILWAWLLGRASMTHLHGTTKTFEATSTAVNALHTICCVF